MFLAAQCSCRLINVCKFSEGRVKMPYEPKVISPYLHLSPFLSPEQSKAVITGINYSDFNKYTKGDYHIACAKVKDDNAECKYNDDVKNEEKLKNNLGCLYGRIKKKLYEGDTEPNHQDQIKYHVAYTKKCINLLNKPPLMRAPSNFISLLKSKLENKAPYTNKTLLNETIYNTAKVFGKVIKNSEDEINDRHSAQKKAFTKRQEYRDRIIELYVKAIVDSANEIIGDIEKKGKDSEYFTPVFSNVLNTKTEIYEKKGTILTKLISQAEKYAFEDKKYKYNNRLNIEKDLKFDQKAEQIIKSEIKKIINNLPQIKEVEAKKTAAQAEELRKTKAANASKSEARTKEQEIKKLEKKIREIKHLEEQNQSKLTSEQKTKLASKQTITNSLQKLTGSKGGRRRTRKLRR